MPTTAKSASDRAYRQRPAVKAARALAKRDARARAAARRAAARAGLAALMIQAGGALLAERIEQIADAAEGLRGPKARRRGGA